MSELRRDPISGRWVVIAPERSRHPRDFISESAPARRGELCPFCEGHEAIAGREILAWRPPGGIHDTPGWAVRVVPNREPALRVESGWGASNDDLFQSSGGLGAHEVIVESPRHCATFANLSDEAIGRVLWAWRERIRDLRRDTRLKSFVVVKNVGAAAGAVLDHPHSQLLALPMVPRHLQDEIAGARTHYEAKGTCVFCDIIEQEIVSDRRLVSSDADTIAFAPFASRVPFETWVMSREHRAAFDAVTDASLAVVAARLGDVMRRLHTTLMSPASTLLLHTAPIGEEASVSYHWHLEVLPRFGPVSGLAFDGGVYVNAVPPEEAAQVLRDARR